MAAEVRRKRPLVISNPVADKQSAPHERVIEFVFPDGTGGLISFRETADGTKRIELYRCDKGFRYSIPED